MNHEHPNSTNYLLNYGAGFRSFVQKRKKAVKNFINHVGYDGIIWWIAGLN